MGPYHPAQAVAQAAQPDARSGGGDALSAWAGRDGGLRGDDGGGVGGASGAWEEVGAGERKEAGKSEKRAAWEGEEAGGLGSEVAGVDGWERSRRWRVRGAPAW